MIHHPLPESLVRRYQNWRKTQFAPKQALYERLAREGQTPHTMVISCCDSRVHATAIFGVQEGEFFMHRNIANLVPPYASPSTHHATPAALEYAIKALEVQHVMILGHSKCGGVRGCYDMCSGTNPNFAAGFGFVAEWLEILRPGYARVKHLLEEEAQVNALEKEGILVSLENLMSFPFVQEAVAEKRLQLHGLWTNIEAGELYAYDGVAKDFLLVGET